MIYAHKNKDIIVNFEDQVYFQSDDELEISECKASIELLKCYPKRVALNEDVSKAIDKIIDCGVILNPEFFLGKQGAGMNRRIPYEFMTRTAFGADLFEVLGNHGVTAVLEKKHGWFRGGYMMSLAQIIASITMMTCGAGQVDDIPKELLIDIINFYRTSDGLRWRDKLLGSEELNVSCFREITRAFGSIYKDNDILEKSRQNRVGHRNTSTWKYIQQNPTPLQRELMEYHERYSKFSRSRPSRDRQLTMDLDRFISENGFVSVRDALAQPLEKNAFTQHYERRNGSLSGHFVHMIRSARRFSDFILSELGEQFPDKTHFPLVTEAEVAFAINRAGNRALRRTQAAARALPERFHFLAKQILDEGAEGWPGRNFTADILQNGESRSVYCPVLPGLLRAAMEIPLRIVQLRRFDSGEGDERRFNGTAMEWEENRSPHARYWLKNKLAKKGDTRGYAFEFSDSDPKITGFFVNTNKTGAPYCIPWMSVDLHKLLWELAEWQIANNPVDGPIAPSDYLEDETPDATEKRLPSIFALFRLLPSAKNPKSGVPPSHGMVVKAFLLLMVEVERRWNDLNPENQVSIVHSYNKVTGQPLSCAYTLHGLRVRGITDLFRAGVPIEILSKVVAGHATIMMTLYYLLFEPTEVNNRLNAAMLANNSAEVTSFANDLRKMQVADAKRKTTFINEAAVEAALTLGDHNQFCNVDIGICPFDGTRCGDGGELLRRDNGSGKNDKSVYGPVPGGARNCIMCRHFISGTPFILQLELFGSKLLWKRNALAQEQQEHRARLSSLHQRRRIGDITPEYFRNASDRLRVENNELKDKIEGIDNAIFNVKLHLEAAAKLVKQELSEGRSPSVSLIANDSRSSVAYTEWSPFDVAVTLSSASRVWSILRDDSLENAKRQFIDQILFNAAETPLSLRADLTAEEKQASADTIAQFLITNVSSAERQSLADGRTSLKELAIDKQVAKLIEQVSFLPLAEANTSRNALVEQEEAQR